MTWQQPAKLCKSGSSAIAALADTLTLPVRGHYFSAKDCDSKIYQRIAVLIQVVPELFSAKQGMQGITGELVTDSDFLSCCRIRQVAACSKQCKMPCELPGTKYTLAALDPALSAENFT